MRARARRGAGCRNGVWIVAPRWLSPAPRRSCRRRSPRRRSRR
jgi:hypothetical protein